MRDRVAVVDYGMGNIRSVLNALSEVGSEGVLVSQAEQLESCRRVILPGVGAFGEAMTRLRASGMDAALNRVRQNGALVFGICLGMQLVCRSSDEGGGHAGLGSIDAEVKRFGGAAGLKVPHMGWNELRLTRDHYLTKGVDDAADVYFVHSYYVACEHEQDLLATSEYGVRFVSMLARDNVLGAQFHPEKSQQPGLRILANFANAPC